jgi:hypothetical protein
MIKKPEIASPVFSLFSYPRPWMLVNGALVHPNSIIDFVDNLLFPSVNYKDMNSL